MRLSKDGKTLLEVYSSDIIDGRFVIPQGVTSVGNYAFFGVKV